MFIGEATNLIGERIFRLARQPAGGAMAAATTKGLLARDGSAAPVANVDRARRASPPPAARPSCAPTCCGRRRCGTQKARLWAAVLRPDSSDTAELWWRADGDNTFHQVDLGPRPAARAGRA